MNLPHDSQIAAWLAAGPDEAPPDSLARALAATRRTRKRPRWTFLERWLPVQLTMTRTRSLRPVFAIVLLALLIVALVATALYIGSQRRLPPSPFRNGAVVYAADGDLFIADQLGGTPRLLVGGPGDVTVPAFSPNGERIAFMSPGTERSSVFTVRWDGSGLTELAGWAGWYGWRLRWAPDGSALVATTNGSSEGGGFGTGPSTWQLAVVAADGSGFRMVDPGPNTHAGRAEWRPDGRQVAFVGYSKPPTRDVFLADRDGTNVRKIPGASDVASDGVAWSPDGKRLSFMRYRADRTVEIVVVELDADGAVIGSTSIRPEPQIPARQPPPAPVEAELTPRWSPDGSQLAYAVVDGRSVRIGTVAPDGSGSRIVGASDAERTDGVDWSPDGRSLVVVRGNPDSKVGWLLDPATGKKTSAEFPIGDWQRLAP
jgi:dipeptidyl aminopeptidase/acylaminoacyl peptidase